MEIPKKWEGKVSAQLYKASADQIWAFYKDFLNIHAWSTGVASCGGAGGNNGEPGCIRHLRFALPGPDGGDLWAKERLVALDDVERSLSYEILESNIGMESYLSTVKIVPDVDAGRAGCVIEWGFSVDPVDGWTLDDFVRKVYEAGLESMAKKMDDAAGPKSPI